LGGNDNDERHKERYVLHVKRFHDGNNVYCVYRSSSSVSENSDQHMFLHIKRTWNQSYQIL